ncbi:hypothetical protein LP316_13585 [Thalassotalea sp. LPB0316]|uniref:hypothetical protein n=1 Tax=Thalassotalea sp. LPB0316 TaxID=2769490 RepID=UPI0018673703|nr:hypothetical protein [Thalassotalea sp. LPB0316]QOL25314.1 hypothetical protein LP316_13585 [Thalassotalea sp. LPB0316]
MPQEQLTKDHCQSLISAVESVFNKINQPRVTADLAWEWDDKHQVLLTHFARNFAPDIQALVAKELPEHWHVNNFKSAPRILREQLIRYGKLSKGQHYYTKSATDDCPALIAIWWPWGHGSTYSLRFGLLEHSYDLGQMAEPSIWHRLKKVFNRA